MITNWRNQQDRTAFQSKSCRELFLTHRSGDQVFLNNIRVLFETWNQTLFTHVWITIAAKSKGPSWSMTSIDKNKSNKANKNDSQ